MFPSRIDRSVEVLSAVVDLHSTATVKSIDLAAYMDQAAIDYVLAVRALHAGSVIMTHAVSAGSLIFI